MNGMPIAISHSSWLIVEEYCEGEGIVVLNKISNHGGKIPYDSIREWREPHMVILSAQVNVGKDGFFEIVPFLDGPETEMLTEDEEILPERKAHVEVALSKCTAQEIEVLKELLIKQTMEQGEMLASCTRLGVPNAYKFVGNISSRTSFLDFGERQKVWIKPVFVPVLKKALLRQKKDVVITSPQPPQSS